MTGAPIPYQQEYADYLEIECGSRPRSIEGYLMDLRGFFQYLRERHFAGEGGVDPARVSPEQVRAYLTHLKEELGNSPHTRNRKLAALKNYYHFLVLHGRLVNKHNPVRHVKKAKTPEKLPALLSLEEARLLIKASLLESFLPFRDHAMMRLFLQTGLRLDELVRLEWRDVKLEKACLLVQGKGDRERLLPLTEATIEALCRHRQCSLSPGRDGDRVFLNHRGKPLTWRGVQMIFDRICRGAGLLRPGLSPHKLRHTCLTLLLREGVDLMTLKELAGHKDINSTEIYAHVDLGSVREAVEKHPLG